MTKLTLLSAAAAAYGLVAGAASAQTTPPESTAGAFAKDTQSSSSSMPASAGATSVPSGAAVAHQGRRFRRPIKVCEHDLRTSVASRPGLFPSESPPLCG